MMNTNNTKKSPWFITAIVLATVAVLLSSVVLVLKITGKKDEGIPPITKEEPVKKEPEEVQKPEPVETLQETEEPEGENGENPIIVEEPGSNKLALDYVPKAGMIFTYYIYYQSGEEGEEKVITTKLNPDILVSKALIMEEDPEPYLIYHFVEGLEGIYLVQNDNPEDSVIWLPNNPQAGDVWEDPYSEYKILEMGVSIDVRGRIFENCIMRKEVNNLMGYVEITYIAPGYGEVYSVSSFELIAEEPDTFERGQDMMKGNITFLEAILRYREK